MTVHRIASTQFIDDLTGQGAYLFGGRWNRQGVRVLYTATSIALAAWEYFVHLPPEIDLAINSFSRISMELYDGFYYEDVPPVGSLNNNSPEELWWYTDKWIKEGDYPYMRVPSFVIEGEFNILINPDHLVNKGLFYFDKVDYHFDERAFNKKIFNY